MTPHVSFVLATHNRCGVLDNTLHELTSCGLDRRDFQIIVVDNASTDQTREVAAGRCDRVINLRRNAGSCAKDYGVRAASGRFVVFLDDDSFPHPGSVHRMIRHFEDQPSLGAAGFVVHLSDGRREGAALPHVFLGCGVGFRKEALRSCGGLDRSFFMQAEEYDLAFRLAADGWDVRMFDDIHVDHLKTAQARKNERTTYYDTRNNLRIAARYLPPEPFSIYQTDWLERYHWLAQRDGHVASFRRGARDGRWRGAFERWTHRSSRLRAAVFEHFFQWNKIQERVQSLRDAGTRRVVLADLGKNVYPFYRATSKCNLEVLAIGDDRFAQPQRSYRGIRILPLQDALALQADTVVVANCSAVHGSVTCERARAFTTKPVEFWFGADESSTSAELPLVSRREAADQPRIDAVEEEQLV